LCVNVRMFEVRNSIAAINKQKKLIGLWVSPRMAVTASNWTPLISVSATAKECFVMWLMSHHWFPPICVQLLSFCTETGVLFSHQNNGVERDCMIRKSIRTCIAWGDYQRCLINHSTVEMLSRQLILQRSAAVSRSQLRLSHMCRNSPLVYSRMFTASSRCNSSGGSSSIRDGVSDFPVPPISWLYLILTPYLVCGLWGI
jgi:hypothetical protein